jgi:hypothetical protein
LQLSWDWNQNNLIFKNQITGLRFVQKKLIFENKENMLLPVSPKIWTTVSPKKRTIKKSKKYKKLFKNYLTNRKI